ncbi:DUF2853 family protein [Rhodopirellula sp. JC740]|uniref:DUF2853 family protein n=1 Tax=Rhodopirellula halodulae TaxID=2894198 RepID=A0ABS8NIK0_9BACT|nr:MULTISPECIES: DUF2853 family protein [unclassified Rhodopirellula]MCC9642311.1 DUF2853 family protein [Rhodopirellula sp. JC740]MCC9654381.1 DUF2853 family protein [Rhodopirellula sp. JC737]
MEKYLANVKKYVPNPNEDAVESLVSHLRLALANHDSSIVAATDPDELAGIKKGYCSVNLDLTSEEADAAIDKVCKIMKGDKAKCRVTFYYLLAQESDTMHRVAG